MPSRIMIVEDERVVASALQHRLEDEGYEVVGNVGKGEAAVDLAARVHPDLILMDINLGSGIDGVEAARRIREQDPIPIIFLTAYVDAGTVARAGATAPFSYLTKPVQDQQIRPAIEVTLQRSRMEREREILLERLQRATAEIEHLRTLLPVCAWCRKVRADDGYWKDLVQYLTERLGANLTHGLCADCASRLESGSDAPGH